MLPARSRELEVPVFAGRKPVLSARLQELVASVSTGRKQRSPGSHLIHLVFLGLTEAPLGPQSRYAHMCIIPAGRAFVKLLRIFGPRGRGSAATPGILLRRAGSERTRASVVGDATQDFSDEGLVFDAEFLGFFF